MRTAERVFQRHFNTDAPLAGTMIKDALVMYPSDTEDVLYAFTFDMEWVSAPVRSQLHPILPEYTLCELLDYTAVHSPRAEQEML